PRPMTIGRVELADGTSAPGFLCEPAALDGAEDITEYGGWRAFRNS
ncbi:allophanate hydrolase-related protein, partial [Streptomyces lunaelactis]